MGHATQLLILALVSVAVLHGAAGEPGQVAHAAFHPTHEPIKIRSPTDLLGPDVLTGNGVRSGTGTALDPFIISGWQIPYGESPGIWIADIDLHVTLRDITFVFDDHAAKYFPAIWVDRSANLRIENVSMTGGHHAVVTQWSDVAADGLVIEDITQDFHDQWNANKELPAGAMAPGWPGGINALGGRLDLQNATIRTAGVGVTVLNGEATVRNVDIVAPVGGLRFSTEAASSVLAVEGLTVRGDAPAHRNGSTDCPPASQADAAGAGGTGIAVTPKGNLRALLTDVFVACYEYGILWSADFALDEANTRELTIRNAVAHGNRFGLHLRAFGSSVSVEDSAVQANQIGLFHAAEHLRVGSSLVATRVSYAGNDIGMEVLHDRGPPVGCKVDTPHCSDGHRDYSEHPLAAGPFAVDIRDSAFVGNDVAFSYEPGECQGIVPPDCRIETPGNYWGPHGPATSGANRLRGPIDPTPAASTAPSWLAIEPGAAAANQQTPPADVTAIAALLVLAAAGRRRAQADRRGTRQDE